jgi:hypothetical protein
VVENSMAKQVTADSLTKTAIKQIYSMAGLLDILKKAIEELHLQVTWWTTKNKIPLHHLEPETRH